MSKTPEAIRTLAVATLAALGFSAYKAATVEAATAKCDTAAAITNVLRHVRGDPSPFEQSFVQPRNHHNHVKVFAKDDENGNKQFMINPGSFCEGKETRYFGITDEPHRSMGRRVKVGYGSGLYLNVIKRSEASPEVEPRDGLAVGEDIVRGPLETDIKVLQLQILHDPFDAEPYHALTDVNHPDRAHAYARMVG